MVEMMDKEKFDNSTTNIEITIDDINKAVNRLNQQKVQARYSYMTWNKFLKLFPYIYEYVVYEYNRWYWKDTYIEIKLYYRCDILTDNCIIFK